MITDVGNVQCSKQMFKTNVQCPMFKVQSSMFKAQCSKFKVQSLQLFRQYEPSFVFLIEFTLKIGIFRHEFHV